MSVQKSIDLTKQYKESIYSLPMDVSGWDTVTFQLVGTPGYAINVYGTINDGMSQGSLYPSDNYGAGRALDWQAVQVVALATGSAVSSMSSAGLYAAPVNYPYLKLEGGDVYGLFQSNIKIG